MFPKTKADYDGSIPMTLHVLRNPWGWEDQALRAVRLKAADFIEQLSIELDAIHALKDMADKANRHEESLRAIAASDYSDELGYALVSKARAALDER